MRNEALLKLAQSAPEIHDMREAYHRMYSAMNIENIDRILPPPSEALALDPNTENMLLMSGKQISVAMFQDDDAHNIVHKQFSDSPMTQSNMPAYVATMMHMQEHKAMKAYKQLQKQSMLQTLQMQLNEAVAAGAMPPEAAEMELNQRIQNFQVPEASPEEQQQIMMSPEVQNMVAVQDAQNTIHELEQQKEQMNSQLDITQVAMADVEQKREAVHVKAGEMKEKVAADVLKTQLQYESEMAKTDSQRETAREKHEVDLLIAQNKT
jgi:hypothetical protein